MSLLRGDFIYKKAGSDKNEEPISVSFPLGLEDELSRQLGEIFSGECYKEGRKKDAVIIDAGANVGMASTYFAPVAKKIYALEPNPVIYEALVENTKNLKNVETFNVGLLDFDVKGCLFSNTEKSIPQTLFTGGDKIKSQEVNLLSLETFMKQNKIDSVDVLKIDVEGSEYVIFPSKSFANVASKIKFIIGESHFQQNSGFPDIIPVLLTDYGFKTRFIDQENCERTFQYSDRMTNEKRTWSVRYKTLFIAER